MGLDISAYRGLQEVADADLDEDGLPVDENLWLAGKLIIEITEEHWPGRSAGVTPGVYSFAEAFHFRAGSYTGFGLWRDALARLVLRMSAEQVWAARPEGPFVELIDFADNEGVIGPRVAAKLAKDFADHAAIAMAHVSDDDDEHGWFSEPYREWQRAFELAADGGAVHFH